MILNKCSDFANQIAMGFILARKSLGINQKQISKRSGLSIYLISNLESPGYNMRIKDAEDYAAVLGKQLIIRFEDKD